jgi:hypothetical protein
VVVVLRERIAAWPSSGVIDIHVVKVRSSEGVV